MVDDGKVTGFISGDALAPPEYILWTMDYFDFKNKVVKDGDCSSIILANDDPEAPSFISVNNPFESKLYIQFNEMINSGHLTLYSLSGFAYVNKEINAENLIELDLQDVPAGVYFLEVYSNERREIIKLIKQHTR